MRLQSVNDAHPTNCPPRPCCTAQQWTENINDAVRLWMSNESIARDMYGDIAEWDTSEVTSLKHTFKETTFNGDLSKWDTSQVTSLAATFSSAASFNGDISKWDTSEVTSLSYTFRAPAFNGDISKWDTSYVTSLSYTFFGAELFNADISKWNVARVTTLRVVSSFTLPTNLIAFLTNCEVCIYARSFNSDLSKWNTTGGVIFEQMFATYPSWGNFQCRYFEVGDEQCKVCTEHVLESEKIQF